MALDLKKFEAKKNKNRADLEIEEMEKSEARDNSSLEALKALEEATGREEERPKTAKALSETGKEAAGDNIAVSAETKTEAPLESTENSFTKESRTRRAKAKKQRETIIRKKQMTVTLNLETVERLSTLGAGRMKMLSRYIDKNIDEIMPELEKIKEYV